jgi:TPR repeat protein
MLGRQGQLPSLSAKQLELWLHNAVEQGIPDACLAAARIEIEANRGAEANLRCAVVGKLTEAEYLLGRLILNRTAAEDESDRFEGLAWVALAAKAGYGPAQRRWEILVPELTAEDLERVEQKAKALRPPA